MVMNRWGRWRGEMISRRERALNVATLNECVSATPNRDLIEI